MLSTICGDHRSHLVVNHVLKSELKYHVLKVRVELRLFQLFFQKNTKRTGGGRGINESGTTFFKPLKSCSTALFLHHSILRLSSLTSGQIQLSRFSDYDDGCFTTFEPCFTLNNPFHRPCQVINVSPLRCRLRTPTRPGQPI